jgi:hypothetical protein
MRRLLARYGGKVADLIAASGSSPPWNVGN